MRIVAMPRSAAIAASRSITTFCVVTSRPVVGSSAINSAGLQEIAIAIITRWHMPPDNSCEAAIRRLQANAWVVERSVVSMEAGKDLLDFRLQRIKQPTLIVWGGEDKLIPPSVGMTMHKQIAGSSLLIVDGCGHLAPGECTKPVLAGTLKFLEAHPPLPASEETVFGAPK